MSELLPIVADDVRPRTRGDCLAGGWNEQRPCTFAACRYNLLADRNRDTFLDDDLPTCALDIADDGDHTLDEVATLIGNVTRERIRQVETKALWRLSKRPSVKALKPDEERTHAWQPPEDIFAEGETTLSLSGRPNLAAPPPLHLTRGAARARARAAAARAITSQPSPVPVPRSQSR